MTYITQTRPIPVAEHYDVIVCGAGPGGWIAATAAARSGAKTALVEKYGFAGGMATAALVVPISVFTYNGQLVCGGIPWEFVRRMEQCGGAEVESPLGNVSFDPEIYKLVAQRMLLESGVHLYFQCVLTGCTLQQGRIANVILDTKSGPMALEGDYVIDSTGDGDLCVYAGVPMQKNVLPLQPPSLCFCLGGVDTDRLEKIHHCEQGVNYHNERIRARLQELARTQEVPNFGGPWFCSIHRNGQVMVNMTRTQADMTDPLQASKAECLLREDVHKMVALLKENFDEFRHAELLFTAAQTGVRETRHIRGVHVLTGEEYCNAVRFEDSVSRGAHPVDIHSSDNSHQECRFLKEAAYIPYRSMIVEGFDNLLVASRCFSADQVASASVRVQASVMGLGQAAGCAAAQCSARKTDVHHADIALLQQTLRDWGAAI